MTGCMTCLTMVMGGIQTIDMTFFSTIAAATIVIYGTFEDGIWSPSHPDLYPPPAQVEVVNDSEN